MIHDKLPTGDCCESHFSERPFPQQKLSVNRGVGSDNCLAGQNLGVTYIPGPSSFDGDKSSFLVWFGNMNYF